MKTLTRRHMSLSALSLATAWLAPATLAQAQALESAKIIVGFPAGSTPDMLARRVAERLAPAYAKNVIVENRTGAGGQLAVSAMKSSPADGATILLTPFSILAIYPHTYKSLPYNAETDLTPVSMGANFDAAFAVGPGVPAEIRTVRQFMQWAKANPIKASFGSPAPGSALHFAGVELSRLSDAGLTHIGYRGTVAAMPDLLSGQLPSIVSPVGEFLRHIPEGRIRVLGTSGAARNPFTPNVPNFAEQGFNEVQFSEGFAFYLPGRAAPSVVQNLNAAIRRALTDPQIREALANFGMEPAPSTPQELESMMTDASRRWVPVIKATGFKAD